MKHDQSLYLRMPKKDLDRLDKLIERWPIMNRSSLVRAAVRLGLDVIEGNPALLIEVPPVKS